MSEKKVPYISNEEIEVSTANALREAELYPTVDCPAVNVERFLEGYLDVDLDQYADLDSDTLGATTFSPGARPKVEINRDLTRRADEEDPRSGQKGRFRMTMSHEAAHIIHHKEQFTQAIEKGELWVNDHEKHGHCQRCPKPEVIRERPVDYREVQANKGGGAILMPREHFIVMLSVVIQELGFQGAPLDQLGAIKRRIIHKLAALCDVSFEAARVRFEALGLDSYLAGGTISEKLPLTC